MKLGATDPTFLAVGEKDDVLCAATAIRDYKYVQTPSK
jgi:hypothetical protein